MGQLYIPNSISLRNFENLFQNIDFDFSDGEINLTFHETYVAMAPIGLAFYAAIGDLIKDRGIENKACINRKIRSIPYLQRMGLFSSMGFINPTKTTILTKLDDLFQSQKLRIVRNYPIL